MAAVILTSMPVYFIQSLTEFSVLGAVNRYHDISPTSTKKSENLFLAAIESSILSLQRYDTSVTELGMEFCEVFSVS